jgi:hypothetical protein
VTDMRDELLERVVAELRVLPPVDEAAVKRIVHAAAADDGAVRGETYRPSAGTRAMRGASWWRSKIPLAAAAGFALAAGLGGFLVGDAGRARPTAVVAEPRLQAPETIATLASADRAPRTADRGFPTQFVLNAPRASSVSLVGDFNGWDAAATPLTRDPSSGIWTTTVRLPAGRHVYAYMINGTVLTLDPRAPTAQDPDFGTPSSVVLVGAP